MFDRPSSDQDLPPEVQRRLEGSGVEPDSIRFAIADGERRVYVGRQGEDLHLLLLDGCGSAACGSFRWVLTDHGAIVMTTSSTNSPDTIACGIVADVVTAVRIGDTHVHFANNAFVAVVPRGAHAVRLGTTDGEREVSIPPS